MYHLTLNVSHVILYLCEQCNGSYCRHALKVIFLPVLVQEIILHWHFGAKAVGNHILLCLCGNQPRHEVAVFVDGIEQFLALVVACEHYEGRCLKVLAVLEVGIVGLLAIGLNGNALLESVGQQIYTVRLCLYAVGALKPLAHLFGVLVHHLPQRAIECGVLYACVLCTSRKALVDHCKAVENVR